MADTLDVLSLAEAKTVLKIDETSNDTRLARVITAISRKLDEACGPIVKRTITTEEHTGLYGHGSIWLRWRPVLSVTTVLSYDTSGTPTTLTAETLASKPSDGYYPERREGMGASYSGRLWRRSSGRDSYFTDSVSVTYVAGRYNDTDSVDAAFKEAASHLLEAHWEQVRPHIDAQSEDLPLFVIPQDVMDEAMGNLPSTERRTRISVA